MSSSPAFTSPADRELLDVLAGSYVIPWRQPLWLAGRFLMRTDGTWVAGIIIFLLLAGILPLTFVAMSIFCMLAVATCLRAFALHEYARQLTELAMREDDLEAGSLAEDDSASEAGSSASTAGSPAGSTPARRRGRRSSLLRAVAAAGRPLSLLNLRLSLVDRDFTDQDYQLLLRLDELEAAASMQPEAPPPLPEAQLALLPVHIHRTPTKKGKRPPQPFLSPADTPKKAPGAGGKPGRREAAAPQGALQPPQLQPQPQQPACVPVLVEQRQQQGAQPPATLLQHQHHQLQNEQRHSAGPPMPLPWASSVKAAPAGPHSGAGGTIKAAPAGGACVGQEIVPAACSPSESEVESEEDVPLCSVCLEPFADGSKILSLPCRHEYHAECVTQWLRYKGYSATCPNCKGQVFTPEQTPEEEEQAVF